MTTNDYVSQFKNIGLLAEKTAAKYKDKPSMTLVLPNGMNGSLSFSELEEKSNRLAIYLREVLKLKLNDKVAVQMPNCLSYPLAALGVFKAGCVLVNMNPLYTEQEMKNQLLDAEAKVLITVDLFADKAESMLKQKVVQHVLRAELTEFMPLFPKMIANLVLKYWDRKIPKTSQPLQSLQGALKNSNENSSTLIQSYLQEVTPESMAVLQYTGGTTGVSKGAMLTHRNILANIHQTHLLLEEKLKDGEEVALTALPLYHIFAFSVNFLTFYAIGARNLLIPNPRPIANLQRAFENFPVSALSGVNTLYNALNNEDWFKAHPPKTLKVCVSGGMALQSAVAETFKKITRLDILEGYGLTETSPVASFNIFARPKPGSIGLPVFETEFKLVNSDNQIVTQPGEPGEIAIRGPQIMKGYWNKPEETANSIRDGWFFSGDIGTFDEDRYFRIVDRKKDMILVSGFNVYPNEVEDVLSHHPDVLEVAVIGIPDGNSGEACLAFIVTRDQEPSRNSLLDHCRKSLVGYKVPKDFIFRKELPKSNVGKILRKDLRQELLNSKGT